MGSFFAELKRRHIYRVAAAYAVVAWLLLQLFNNLAPILKLPDWAGTFVLVVLIGGFPIIILFAWTLQFAGTDGSMPAAKTSRLDLTLVGALVLVIALVSYEQLAPSRSTSTQASIAPATSAAGISIAVLPFANMSGDATQEFFSDGMTEEITSALAKVSKLTVLGRTSAFQFKGQNKDLRDIGQQLGATHLIEGSVRKVGSRVRITAQLIRADNGAHLWTENYDRDLTDVFGIQEDIAQAIVGALQVPLGLQRGERLVANRTGNLESYGEYLRARTLYRSRAIGDAIAVLEPVVARDPEFAPAWALLAASYERAPTYDPSPGVGGSVVAIGKLYQAAGERAEKAAREALRLDSKSATAYTALADVEFSPGKWAAAEDLYRQALALDPNDPDVVLRYMIGLNLVGRFKDALPLAQKLRTLDPFVPVFNVFASEVMFFAGQSDEATKILEAVPVNGAGGYYRNAILATYYAHQGRFEQAADTLLAIPPQQNPVSRGTVVNAARLLRSAPYKGSPDSLPSLEGLDWFYFYLGAPDRFLDILEHRIDARAFVQFPMPWPSEMAPVRKSERYKALMRKAGFVDYWKARGWPDLCRPVGTDDFECS